MPQNPQLSASLVVSLQPSVHAISPSGQPDEPVHALFSHVPPSHELPQKPQLSASVDVSVHPAEHIISPLMQLDPLLLLLLEL